jgi:hypothetical protein
MTAAPCAKLMCLENVDATDPQVRPVRETARSASRR